MWSNAHKSMAVWEAPAHHETCFIWVAFIFPSSSGLLGLHNALWAALMFTGDGRQVNAAKASLNTKEKGYGLGLENQKRSALKTYENLMKANRESYCSGLQGLQQYTCDMCYVC